MADEVQKYVTLDTLKTYDGKLKPWVKDKIKSVKVEAKATADGNALKTYELKFTDGTDVTSLGTIDIPKDFLVKSGSVVIVKADPDTDKGEEAPTENRPAGTYIKLVINSKDDLTGEGDPLYINVADLYSDYKAQENATQIQLEIGDDHVISATVVAGSITVTELDDDAVETDKIKDNAVTGAKIDIGTVTGGVTEGVATGNIAKDTIVNENLVDETILSGKIADSAIITAKIADVSVTNAKIADTTIARGKIDEDFENAIKALENFMGNPTKDSDIAGLEPGQEKPEGFDGFDWT